MPGFHRGATAGAVLLAASLAMPVGATPRLQASESACRDGEVAVALHDASLQLRLLPQREYVGWLEESGVDARVGVDADREPWIDSGPSRYAREPLRFRSASDGLTGLPLQVSATASGDTALAVQLQCLDALPQSAQRHWQRVWRFVQARSDFQQAASGATIMRVGWHALDLLSAEQTPATDRQWLLQQVAGLLRGHGHYREAGQWYALAARAAADDPRRAALAALAVAQSAFASGDDAAAQLLAVRARLRALGLSYPSAVAAHDHCLALRVGGEIARAADCLQSVAAEFAAIGEPDQRSNALRNRATALLMLGRYREAEADLVQAMRALGARDDPRSRRQRSLAAQVQAQLRTWAGDFEQALALLYETLLERQAAGSEADVAHLRRLLGSTYALAGEPERAGVHYRMAIDYYAQRQLGARAASVRLQLADVRLAQGQAAEAEALWRQARSELRPDSAIAPWSEATLRLAQLMLRTQRGVEAASLLAETGQAGVELPWKWQAERAMLHWQLRRDAADVASLQAQRVRAGQGGHILLQLELDATLMEAALAAGDVGGAVAIADGAVATGLQAASRLRSPGLRHALLERLREPARLRLRLLPAGRVREADVLPALAPLERLRRLEQAPLPPMDTDAALTELERRIGSELLSSADETGSREREQLLLAWHRAEAAAQGAIAAGAAAMSLAPLAEGETWLYVVAGESDLGLLRRDAEGWFWSPGLPLQPLRDAVTRLQGRLAQGHGQRDAIDADIAAVASALRWSSLLPRATARLAVVTDADLAMLPWELLPAPQAGSEPLLQHSQVELWQSLAAQPQRLPTQLRSLIATPLGGTSLAALPQLAAEAEAVAAAWRTLPASGDGVADRAQLLQALATPEALVHIASHGRGDGGRSEESGLWLQHDGQPEFVSALRLRQSPVAAALVVLSACESGYSAGARRFGVGGVAGSVVDAGAGAAIGSRWPVSDRAAQAFAATFHAALARDPSGPAAALREAQLALRRQPAWRHPAHWAGWFLLRPGPVANDPSAAAR